MRIKTKFFKKAAARLQSGTALITKISFDEGTCINFKIKPSELFRLRVLIFGFKTDFASQPRRKAHATDLTCRLRPPLVILGYSVRCRLSRLLQVALLLWGRDVLSVGQQRPYNVAGVNSIFKEQAVPCENQWKSLFEPKLI